MSIPTVDIRNGLYRHRKVEACSVYLRRLAPDVALHGPRHKLDVREVATYTLYELLSFLSILFLRLEKSLDVSLTDHASLVIKFEQKRSCLRTDFRRLLLLFTHTLAHFNLAWPVLVLNEVIYIR